jgi:hypothetical protein
LARVSADIITTARASVALGRIYMIGPRDTFGPRTRVAFAIVYVHNLPAHAQVGARWIFPDGRRIVYVCPVSDCPPRRFVRPRYTYWVEQTLAGPGQYAVSALINGRAVGVHHFSVEAGASAPDQDDRDNQDTPDQDDRDNQDTPDTTPAMELGGLAAKPARTRHRRYGTAQPAWASLSPDALRRCSGEGLCLLPHWR